MKPLTPLQNSSVLAMDNSDKPPSKCQKFKSQDSMKECPVSTQEFSMLHF